MEFKVGEEVIYEGYHCVIEEITEDGNFVIDNPHWESDEDDDYIPFWIIVKPSDITKIKKER